MTALCPHCRQTIPPAHGITLDTLTVHRGPSTLALTRREARIFVPLLRRFSHAVTTDVLIGALYPNDNDEPESSNWALKTTVSILRKKLRALDLTIRPEWGVGYSLHELVAEKAEA